MRSSKLKSGKPSKKSPTSPEAPTDFDQMSADPVTPCLSKPKTTVVKSGLVKVALQRMGRTHWKLRNAELCWDHNGAADVKGKLRLTIFPVKESKTHHRTDIPLCSPKALQIVSDRFPGKHVLLLRADVDYYLSTETEAAVIDWVATLKAAMAQRAEEPCQLYDITILPNQQLVPSGKALLSFRENSLVLQKPVSEELSYMCTLTSVMAFGANINSLTWWFEVCEQRRRSTILPKVQRVTFSTQNINSMISEMKEKMETANGSLLLEETAEGLIYRVPTPDLNSLCRYYDSGDTYLVKQNQSDGSISPDFDFLSKSCPSPQKRPSRDGGITVAQPPRELINQLIERQSRGIMGSTPNLSQSSPALNCASSHSDLSAAAAVAKALSFVSAPPKPPRAHNMKRTTSPTPPRSPPSEPPEPPPPYPTPVPRAKPEKPQRSLQSRQASSPAILPSTDHHVYSQVEKGKTREKPTPAPRLRSKSNPGIRTGSQVPPTPQQRTASPKFARPLSAGSPASTPKKCVHTAASPQTGPHSPLCPTTAGQRELRTNNSLGPPHPVVEETNSGGSDFAYDYLITVDHNGTKRLASSLKTPQGEINTESLYYEEGNNHNILHAINSCSSGEVALAHKPSTSTSEEELAYDLAMPLSIPCDHGSSDSDLEVRRNYFQQRTQLSSRRLYSSTGESPDEMNGHLPPRDPPDGQETVRGRNTASDFQSEDDDPVYINLPHDRLPIESDDEDESS